MQISIDEIKNIRKFLSFNKPNASSPIISPKDTFLPDDDGGVSGRKKLNKPSNKEAIAANRNVFINRFDCSHPSLSMNSPATIHPMVPKPVKKRIVFRGW